jgi:hypothetical protein
MLMIHPALLRTCAALLMALLLGSACSSRNEERLIILHTGRLCGNVYPLDARGIAPLQHYPYLAGTIKKVREEASARGARVLLLDSGDSLGGSFASHATGGANVATLFNTLGYDAVFLGNLDANLDPSVIARLNMPVLVPFTRRDGSSPLPGTSPARAIKIGGDPVILAANFYGDTPAAEFPQRFPLWFGGTQTAVQPVRNIEEWITPLARSHPGAPILFHWMKFEAPDQPPALVQRLKDTGVNAILAHRIYNSGIQDTWDPRDYSHWPLPVSENLLRQNGGFTLARIDLVKRNGSWVAAEPHRVIQLTADTAPADPVIIQAINQFTQAIRSADRDILVLPHALPEKEFLSRYTRLLGETTRADAVLYSAASIRAPLPSGTLTANRLFATLPWTAPLAAVLLDAEQLGQATTLDNLHLWKRPALSASTTPLRVVTSLYTARLLQQRLNLPETGVTVLDGGAEFDHAVRLLAAQPGALTHP